MQRQPRGTLCRAPTGFSEEYDVNYEQLREKALGKLPILFACQEENCRLKITTPFLYPDGDYIDLYLIETPTGPYLTDLGETMGYLADHNISLRQSPKRRQIINDVLLTQGVELFRGELRVPLDDWDKTAWAITRLSQAVVQTSDLVFSLRLSALTTFKEEVEEYWIESRIPYDVEALQDFAGYPLDLGAWYNQ
jgi:hypothetical protein